MNRYEQVIQILENAVHGDKIGAHGNFWRGKTRDQFVATKVFAQQLLVVGNSADSNIVKALRGQNPFDDSKYPQMPANYPPIVEDQIQIIAKWIDDGCPETPSQ
jgi:hypothetical protein